MEALLQGPENESLYAALSFPFYFVNHVPEFFDLHEDYFFSKVFRASNVFNP